MNGDNLSETYLKAEIWHWTSFFRTEVIFHSEKGSTVPFLASQPDGKYDTLASQPDGKYDTLASQHPVKVQEQPVFSWNSVINFS